MSESRFDISLPGLYKENWREAYRSDKEDSPRLSSYQAPENDPIPFIYKSLDFSGGQSIDTSEYPFFGLWSNETLNKKPQTITVHGFLRGEYYLQQRAAFIDALMIPTSDDSPGFFDHPLWGRFKVVVENYNIQESANESGQCEISLTLKRAGVSLDTRAAVLSPVDFIKPKEVAFIAAKNFAQTEKNTATLLQSFGTIKTLLLGFVSRIRAAQTILNTLTNEISGISNLIAQGVKEPLLLTQSMVNAVFSITAAAASVSESAETTKNYFLKSDNKKNIVMMFFSSLRYKLPIDAITTNQAETKNSTENMFRAVCLCASAELLMQMDDITFNKMNGYWALYVSLENSINLEDPDLYKITVEMRSMLSQILKQKSMNNELKKNVKVPVPLLLLSHYLGCDEERLRAMNLIEDSLLISGEVSYV